MKGGDCTAHIFTWRSAAGWPSNHWAINSRREGQKGGRIPALLLSTDGRPLLNESRRRAYLTAMQVVSWLPRTELPFAAPSRPELLVLDEVPVAPVIAQPVAKAKVVVAPSAPAERPKIEVPRPSVTVRAASKPVVEADVAPVVAKAAPVPPPRFALQLLRAGRCLVLVELPTGGAFQSRDPAYLLLKDMLRAAGLPDSPQIIGEPIRWPLLRRGNVDQGPDAVRSQAIHDISRNPSFDRSSDGLIVRFVNKHGDRPVQRAAHRKIFFKHITRWISQVHQHYIWRNLANPRHQPAPFSEDENLAIVQSRDPFVDHCGAHGAFIDDGNAHDLLCIATWVFGNGLMP